MKFGSSHFVILIIFRVKYEVFTSILLLPCISNMCYETTTLTGVHKRQYIEFVFVWK